MKLCNGHDGKGCGVPVVPGDRFCKWCAKVYIKTHKQRLWAPTHIDPASKDKRRPKRKRSRQDEAANWYLSQIDMDEHRRYFGDHE